MPHDMPSRLRRGWIAGLAVALAAAGSSARAEVKTPAIFGDHMVLQRDQANPVWGWADPGEEVTVKIGDQTKTTKAGDDGAWRVALDPLPAGGPLELTVEGKNKLSFGDVLVGEVWICSGQSNMQFSVSSSIDGDLEALTADRPQIRLITVPQGPRRPDRQLLGRLGLRSLDPPRPSGRRSQVQRPARRLGRARGGVPRGQEGVRGVPGRREEGQGRRPARPQGRPQPRRPDER